MTDTDTVNRTGLYERWIREEDVYKKVRLIGKGRFGSVYLAEDMTTHEQVALRQLSDAPGLTRYILRTVEMTEIKPHPCMCDLRGYNPNPPLIMMQYMPNGSLASLLEPVWKKGSPSYWNGTLRAKILFGVAAAMQHLHAHGGVHRYLTPSNILFDRNWEPRVSDFGFARVMGDGGALSAIQCTVDSYMYTSPEALQTDEYTQKTDVFSYGMIIYAVVTGLQPRIAGVKEVQHSQQAALVEGKRPVLPPGTSEVLATLITHCWEQNETLRPTFAQILRTLSKYDEMLFDDVDMDDYLDFRKRVLSATTMRPLDREQFWEPEPEDGEFFERTARLAEGGDVNAIVRLGMLYSKGTGTVKDDEKSFKCFKQAAERGSATGMYNTAVCYMKGEGCEKNMRSGMVWLKRAVEKRLPCAESLYAKCLSEGEGVDKDEDAALRIWKRLSEPPYERADDMCEYAYLLETRGQFAEAREWYQKSSDLGCDEAACCLALMHLKGAGCPQNIPEGIRLYEMAAERSFARANSDLGIIYKYGQYGQACDIEKAKKYLRRAIVCGSAEAIHTLANCYLRECNEVTSHVDKRALEEKAYSILKRGIYQDPLIMHRVGLMQYQGIGTPVARDDGLKLLREAAQNRCYHSAVFLGDLFAHGDPKTEVAKNLNFARGYYQKAQHIARNSGQAKDVDIVQAKIDALA